MINLTPDEFVKVIDLLSHDHQRRLFFKLAYYHGMRRGELLRLTAGDFRADTVTIRPLKRRKDITVVQPLHPNEITDAAAFLWIAPDGRLFPWSPSKASNMVRQILTDAGIYTAPYQKSLHSLRHSCGRAIYRATHDIVQVAEYLRHASVESSRIYAHPDASEIFETVRKAL